MKASLHAARRCLVCVTFCVGIQTKDAWYSLENAGEMRVADRFDYSDDSL
jgi:hypothetical protein